MLVETITVINLFILWYFIILNAGYILLLIFSISDILYHYKEIQVGSIFSLTDSSVMPPVTIILSAHNEEKDILETLYSIFRSDYDNLHVIVINDGSTDNTLNKLIDTFALREVPYLMPKLVKTHGKIKGFYLSQSKINLLVVDKENTGKSDSLNVGLNLCRTPLFITYDADTIIEPETITNMVYSMLTKPYVIAIGGAIYILNGCEYKDGELLTRHLSKKPIYGLQVGEYLRSFLFSRCGWNKFGGALCYAGALTLFEHREVLKVKGFQHKNTAQDFEIITHLHAFKRERQSLYNISYTPAARAWTNVPGTFREFWRQRSQWQFGSLESLMRHKRMLFNPKYGIVGLFTYPFFLFGEILGPIVEFIAYLSILASWYINILSVEWALLFVVLCWGLVSLMTMVTVLISIVTDNSYLRTRDVFWIFLLIIFESFGFRQFHVLARVEGTLRYLFGIRQ